MTREEALQALLRIAHDDIGVTGDIPSTISVLNAGIMDSMDWIAFLSRVEETFGIQVLTEEADSRKIAVLENFADLLVSKVPRTDGA